MRTQACRDPHDLLKLEACGEINEPLLHTQLFSWRFQVLSNLHCIFMQSTIGISIYFRLVAPGSSSSGQDTCFLYQGDKLPF